jgi:hypothetical protein
MSMYDREIYTDMNNFTSFGRYYANNVYDTSNAPFADNPYITKMTKILDWIKDNFEEEGDKIQSVRFVTTQFLSGAEDVYRFRIQYLFSVRHLDITKDLVENVILVD